MRAGRLHHAGNHVLTWCIGDVVGKADRRGNLYPTKSRPDQKIDAAVALMMAVGRAMVKTSSPKDWMVPLQFRFLDKDNVCNSDLCPNAEQVCATCSATIRPERARQSACYSRQHDRQLSVASTANRFLGTVRCKSWPFRPPPLAAGGIDSGPCRGRHATGWSVCR